MEGIFSQRHWGVFAAGLAAGISLVMLMGTKSQTGSGLFDPLKAAQSEGNSLVAITSRTETGAELICLIDPQDKVLSIYEYDSKKTRLKLAAVRQFSSDHQLAEFNNEPPKVADIEKLVHPR